MAASCLPCTWLVAFEQGHALKPFLFQSPNRRKNKLMMIKRCSNSSTFDLSRKQCYKRICRSSLAFFDDNAFSHFESKATIIRRRQNHANQAAYSATNGNNMAMSEQSEKKIMKDKKNPEEKRRVVVTGLGALTPLGDDAHSFYTKLLEGVSGITEIEGFDCSDLPTRIAGEIKTLSTGGLVAPKYAKRADKYLIYALTASKKALADGGITEQVSGQLDKSRCGVLIGTAMGGMQVLKDAIAALKISYKKISPFSVPYSLTSMASAVIAMDLEWMGPNYAISSTCATSNYCILNAANHIIEGDADMMLCGGSDGVIIPEGIAGFLACSALSQRNSDPTKASRPWDSDRDGFVMGEGAGVLLLEELQHAKRRGANIYAEFLGGSFIFRAYHISESHLDEVVPVACLESSGVGEVACIEKALAHSGVTREDVNYINAHATSTRVGDCREFKAVMRCFGKNPELRMNSTKSMIGHLLGAAGGVEAIATVKAIQTGWIHPNINLENPDKDMDTRVLVGSKKERLDIKVAMSNSFGFAYEHALEASINKFISQLASIKHA